MTDTDEPSSERDQSAEQEVQLLRELADKPWPARVKGYVALSGPGWLQSAITLGGGSLGSSLYLGVLGGFALLWVQPLAMILGIIMLSAIGYVTLSTGERPFQAINKHVNPVLGWGWALATLAANMVWALPQYSLATGVLQQNLLPELLGNEGALGSTTSKLLIASAILIATTAITWAYDSGHWGVRLYERMLKVFVAAIVLCFFGVVAKMSFSGSGIDWSGLWSGFVPNFQTIFEPAPGFAPLLESLESDARTFWTNLIVSEQRNVMISAAATAVGINMTFLLPYTLLARGWGREHRGLSIFDLSTGMFIPYVLATSCVVIAAAQQFHPALRDSGEELITWSELSDKARGSAENHLHRRAIGDNAYANYQSELNKLQNAGAQTELERLQAQRATVLSSVSDTERQLAAAVVRRDAADLARSLRPITNDAFADYVFGLGVLGMTLSTITILMLISGFVICEMLGLPTTGWPYRLGCLAAATGALGPFFWQDAAFYLVVPTSVFGFMLIPIAYLTFFLLINQKSLLGDNMPRGWRRVLGNTLMAAAAGITTVASVASVWFRAQWAGIAAIGAFVGAALVAHLLRRSGKNE